MSGRTSRTANIATDRKLGYKEIDFRKFILLCQFGVSRVLRQSYIKYSASEAYYYEWESYTVHSQAFGLVCFTRVRLTAEYLIHIELPSYYDAKLVVDDLKLN